jgi:hypothetical protein
MRFSTFPFSSVLSFLFASAMTAGAVDAILTDDYSLSTKVRKWDAPNLQLSETEALLLRFDVVAVLPSNITADQIGKATLRLWASKVTARGFCGVYPLSTHWKETDRSGMDLYPLQFGPVSQYAFLDRSKSFLVADVTEIVRGWISGTPNFGIALRGARPLLDDGFNGFTQWPSMEAQFDSKENVATGHLPTLQIVLVPGTP